MANSISLIRSNVNIKSILIDVVGLAFIYFVPTLSHLAGLPLYLLEPMRIMLILAMAHTTQKNAYILALTLPLFSFAISMHPTLVKTLLITAELVLNVWLFYFLLKKVSNQFVAMLSSILLSKVVYYLVKFLLISLVVMQTDLFSTPVLLQFATAFIFSGYIYLIYRRRELLTKND
ncbi:MAG: hypothetical protein KQI35_04820 [Bacteroidetes bacterium]|nr:hypothetical protein [Bacteroidota bacterium]